MKRIVFVLSTVPHGAAVGCEGLDALLVIPALTNDLTVSSIADGAFQSPPGQKPGAVPARDYIATFKLLGLYDIEQYWVRAALLRGRGLGPWTPFVAEATPFEADVLRCELADCSIILRFWDVMLHTLHHSPWLTDFVALLRLFSEDNKLLLLQDGVTATIGGNRYLESPCNAPIKIYTLNEDPIAHDLTGRISSDTIPIDYTDFVRPTVKHSNQMA